MSISGLLIPLFVVVFVLDLLAVAVRASLLYARLPKLTNLQEEHPQAIGMVMHLLESNRLRATLRSWSIIVHMLMAGSGWMFVQGLLEMEAGLPLMILILVVGGILVSLVEFAVERLVLQNVEAWAMRLVPVGVFMEFLFRPISSLMVALLGSPAELQSLREPVIETELKSWAMVDQDEGGLDKDERKMIYSIFQFSYTLCREIMVPRIDIFALDGNTLLAEAIRSTTLSGHSRVPVYDDSIDNIIGVLYVKDLLREQLDSDDPDKLPIRNLLRPAYFVPESKKVSELLREMQAREVHLSIVVDEYGGTAGVVTLEDIVEEIVGEIRDEYDQAEELLFQQVSEGEYIFHGRIDLDDFNELMDTELTNDSADTLGGFIYGEIGRVPVEGEQIQVDDWLLTVEKVSRRRIYKVRANRSPILKEDEDKSDAIER